MDGVGEAARMVGAVLGGRLRLVRLLGEGGMGAVFEAEDLAGGPRVAVKLLHPELVANEEVRRRFVTEGQLATRLVHPSIVRVFGPSVAEDGTPYLVMELLDGSPLAAYTRSHVAFPPEQAGPIVYAVLQALAEAHRQGVVHRDLKPENVLLARGDTGRFVVKVVDFGLAKVMDAAGGMGSRTRTGALLGTPGYMSPEQVRDAKRVDARSDLWAAGVIFYELLTGRSPFEADNPIAKLTAVLVADAIPIERDAPALERWRGFFERALAREVEARFASADEMAHALVLVARGPTGRPPGVIQTPPPPPAAVQASYAPPAPPPPEVQAPAPVPSTLPAPPPSEALDAHEGPPTVSLLLAALLMVIAAAGGFIAGWLAGRG